MADPKEKKVTRPTGPKKTIANFPKIERLPMPHEKLVRIVPEPEQFPSPSELQMGQSLSDHSELEIRTPAADSRTPAADSRTPAVDSRESEFVLPNSRQADSRTPENSDSRINRDLIKINNYVESLWPSRQNTRRLQSRLPKWKSERLEELSYITHAKEVDLVNEAIDLLFDKYYGADIRTPENSDSRTPENSDSRKFGLQHVNKLTHDSLINNALQLYSNLTGNAPSDYDVDTCLKLASVSEVDIELGIRQAVDGARRGHKIINGFGYCATTILNVSREKDPNKAKRLLHLRYKQSVEQG